MEWFISFVGVLIIVGPLVVVIQLYIQFKRSCYAKKSGHSFIQTLFDKGSYGEYKVVSALEKVIDPRYIFCNVYLGKGGNTTEIDVLFIDTTGLYVIESKNYSGWIFGGPRQKEWTQSLFRHRYHFLNPILQNKRHIAFLEKELGMKGDIFKSYIVFSDHCHLKKVPYDDRFPIMHVEAIEAQIEMKTKMSPVCLEKEELENIIQFLEKHTRVSKALKKKHVENVKRKMYYQRKEVRK